MRGEPRAGASEKAGQPPPLASMGLYEKYHATGCEDNARDNDIAHAFQNLGRG